MGSEYLEAQFVEEAGPDGTTSDEISPLHIAYPLIPRNGRYGSAKFHIQIEQIDSSTDHRQTVSDNRSHVVMKAEIQDNGDWGYKIHLYSTNNAKKIGSLQASPSFDESNTLAEDDIISLQIKIKYDHEYTKDFLGFSESDAETARREAKEWRECIREN